MGSLFKNMTKRSSSRKGSYGIVPGNGNPRADDKNMNAGPGHVVPHENVDAAKEIVETLGYEPNQKVSLNQGGGQGQDIKISSKEYFLNDEIVERMKNELGIDPETLSPNSPYNKRVNGGTTKQVENMVDEKLSMYELMSNNNNQYANPAAYQNGGGTGGHGGYPMEFQKLLHKDVYGDVTPTAETLRASNAMAQKEWPGYLAGTGQYGYIEMSPETMGKWDATTGKPIGSETTSTSPTLGTGDPSIQGNFIPGVYNQDNIDELDWSTVGGGWGNMSPEQQQQQMELVRKGGRGFDLRDPDNPVQYIPGKELDPYSMQMPSSLPTWEEKTGKSLQLPEDTFTNRNNYPDGRFPEDHELYDPEIDSDPTDPRYTSEFGEESPEEKALSDLKKRSEDLTKNEKLSNAGMALWNMSRQYKDLPEPIRIRPSSTRLDIESLKAGAEKDVSKQAALSNYINKQMGGSPVGTTGISANQMDAQNQISQSLWNMSQQTMNQDMQREDQYNSTWIGQKIQRDMQNQQLKSAFAQDKGDKIAGNIREIHDAEEAGLYRDQGLISEKSSMDMDAKYLEYKNLDKKKMMAGKDPDNPKSAYLPFSDYLKMSDEERKQLGELYSS